MCLSWRKARDEYYWCVDLSDYRRHSNYEGYFNRVIGPDDVTGFEDAFRDGVESGRVCEVAGEVCFWKNYGYRNSRDRITRRLLVHLSDQGNSRLFIRAIKDLSLIPSASGIRDLQGKSGMPHGFATPLTFLSFYDPARFPMVDKEVATWWSRNKELHGYAQAPNFSQNERGLVQADTIEHTLQNWEAYESWAKFCVDMCSRLLSRCGFSWRARDVEMAVWQAQRKNMPLHPI